MMFFFIYYVIICLGEIMKKKNKIIISMILNIIIVLFVLFAGIIMFTGIRFMHGPEVTLECSNIEMFKFFTVDSNILMAIASLVFIIYEIKLLKKKIKKIPRRVYLLKYVGTSAVSLTFLVVFLYLGWIAENGLFSLLKNSNLFLHLLVPVISVIAFIFFEKNNELKFKDAFFGLLPMEIYGICYIGNVLIHINHGKVSPVYDFYWFVQNGVWTIIIALPLVAGLNYLSCYLLWKFNRK